MINNYQTYKQYREIEKSKGSLKNFFFPEPTQLFIKWLRRLEWHFNAGGLFHKILFIYAYWRYRKISLQTGFSIPKNVCESGLSLPHFGSIVINANCKIGKNCRIQNNVNIGATGGSSKAPKIGNNVYIGPGAVIYGDIEIADHCYIGANAVVNKSFIEPYSVIAGVPAKVMKKEEKAWNEK
jgi:serine O-acetyltransferase